MSNTSGLTPEPVSTSSLVSDSSQTQASAPNGSQDDGGSPTTLVAIIVGPIIGVVLLVIAIVCSIRWSRYRKHPKISMSPFMIQHVGTRNAQPYHTNEYTFYDQAEAVSNSQSPISATSPTPLISKGPRNQTFFEVRRKSPPPARFDYIAEVPPPSYYEASTSTSSVGI